MTLLQYIMISICLTKNRIRASKHFCNIWGSQILYLFPLLFCFYWPYLGFGQYSGSWKRSHWDWFHIIRQISLYLITSFLTSPFIPSYLLILYWWEFQRATDLFLFAAENGTGSADTLKGAPRCLDQSGHHPGVLPEHEHQSKLPVDSPGPPRVILRLRFEDVCAPAPSPPDHQA